MKFGPFPAVRIMPESLGLSSLSKMNCDTISIACSMDITLDDFSLLKPKMPLQPVKAK